MIIFNYLLEHNRYLNILGILLITLIAVLLSRNRRAINVRIALSALALHILCASIILANDWGAFIMKGLAEGAAKVSIFTDPAIDFVFGQLGNIQQPWGFIFAVKVVPVVIFVGALTALLFHWGIIQALVHAINMLIRPILGTSGIETMATIANALLGQTEAALFMSNYLPVMTHSELFVLMTSGMAAISIAVMVIYTLIGIPAVHLLGATLMSIPASLFIAKIMVPETDIAGEAGRMPLSFETRTTNIFDAIAKGTMDGLKLGVSVLAMLISFLALLAMSDYLLGFVSMGINLLLSYLNLSWHMPDLTIARILSYLFAPFAYLLGFSGAELWDAGRLLGIKVSVNELVAFNALVKTTFSSRSFIIMTYALCGFSNVSCIGIQIGMIGALAPKQRPTMTQLGVYAVIASSLANLLSAMVVGLLL